MSLSLSATGPQINRGGANRTKHIEGYERGAAEVAFIKDKFVPLCARCNGI